MAENNSFNYAEGYSNELFEIITQNTLSSPFLTNNVTWLGKKSFHFSNLQTTGFKNHNRNGGWNKGTVKTTDIVYTLEHDRDVQFLVDVSDVDETDQVASIQNISNTFERVHAAPEVDATFFEKIASEAKKADLLTETAFSSYTTKNVYSKIIGIMSKGKLKFYRQRGSLVLFIRSEIMDLLEQSEDFTRTIEVTTIAEGTGIETRVTRINGVPIFEVVDETRFYNKFNYDGEDGGFEPVKKVSASPGPAVEGSKRINILAASLETVKTVPKVANIYMFNPGTHTEGDGYLYQNHQLWDTFVFPNGLDGKVDSIFVDLDTEEYTAE